jgi:hypothetical protein
VVPDRASSDTVRPGFLVEHSFILSTYYFRWRARRDPRLSNYYEHLRAAYDGPLWDKQQARLRSFRDACQAAGGRLVVVIFPLLHSLGPNYSYRSVHEQLRCFWRECEVPCLDLLPTLESHLGETLTVNRYDVHPNEYAHTLAAEAIVRFMEKEPR